MSTWPPDSRAVTLVVSVSQKCRIEGSFTVSVDSVWPTNKRHFCVKDSRNTLVLVLKAQHDSRGRIRLRRTLNPLKKLRQFSSVKVLWTVKLKNTCSNYVVSSQKEWFRNPCALRLITLKFVSLLTEPWHSKLLRVALTVSEILQDASFWPRVKRCGDTTCALTKICKNSTAACGICCRELCLSRERNVGILLFPWPSYVEILVTDLLQGLEYQNLPKQTDRCSCENWMQAKTSEPIEYNLSAPIIL